MQNYLELRFFHFGQFKDWPANGGVSSLKATAILGLMVISAGGEVVAPGCHLPRQLINKVLNLAFHNLQKFKAIFTAIATHHLFKQYFASMDRLNVRVCCQQMVGNILSCNIKKMVYSEGGITLRRGL